MKHGLRFSLVLLMTILVSGCSDLPFDPSSSDFNSTLTDSTVLPDSSSDDPSSSHGEPSLPDSSIPVIESSPVEPSTSYDEPSTPNLPSNNPSTSSYDDPTGYYSGININSSTLLNDLRTLITRTHHTETTYAGLANVFKRADADPNKSGNILWFYTGTSVSFNGFGKLNGQTNREHVWPKDGGDAFPEKSKAGSDAHHLRPTETNLNSNRGSLSFDVVPQTPGNIAKQNGSTTYNSGDELCYKSGSFFYPGAGWRGQTARILFYVYARWGGAYNLSFVDNAGSCKTIGKLSTLLQWNLDEPVSEFEMNRNEVVFDIQGNRNPFIDHPEYACQLFKNFNSATAAVCQ